MASQEVQDLEYNAAHTLGQAQMRKPNEEYLNKASDALVKQALDNLSNSQSSSNFIQQTGEQVKSMAQGAGEQVKNLAQGAADAVKNTLGMNDDNNTTATATDASGSTTDVHPRGLAVDHLSNPTNHSSISTSYNPSNPKI